MVLSELELESLPAFLISLGIGLLMGLERERKPDSRAGLRTFGLTAIAGTLCALLTEATGTPWLVPAALLGLTAMMIAAHRFRGPQEDAGTTTTVALLLCFILGVLLWYGYRQLAVAIAFTAVSLLYFKAELHGLIRRLSPRDLVSFLQFAIVTFIVLPVLPDRSYGPYAVLNPYRIWLMVVLITGLGLAGYAVLRIAGPQRGTPLLGLLGGLVSSTATTLTFSRHMRSTPSLQPIAVFVILLANLVVLGRLAIIAAVAAPRLLPQLLPVLGLGIAAGLCVVAWHWLRLRQRHPDTPELEMQNPVEMRAALSFAALYALVLFAAAWLNELAGTRGLYLAAAVSGLTDVDAITLSSLDLYNKERLAAAAVAGIVVLAYAANLAFKLGVVFTMAGAAAALRVLGGFAVVLAGLLAGLLLF
jgi:uncharacterized membrane protein (DUF4010 family)